MFYSFHFIVLFFTEEYKIIEKTSCVDLAITDKVSRTALHYAVSSFEYASFDNADIVYVLAKAGAPIQARNSDGQTALDLARKNNCESIVKILTKLLAMEPYNKPATPYEKVRILFRIAILFVCFFNLYFIYFNFLKVLNSRGDYE